jgi:hypothetical protein
MSQVNYPLRFFNPTGEPVPAFAVMQESGWVADANGLPVFRIVKPTASGKVFMLNGPSVVLPASGNETGIGYATREPGAFALHDPALTPVTDQELGAVAGQWYLGAGSGFFVVGNAVGAGPSLPGFPATAADKRVRVVIQAAAPADNVILGYPTDNISAGAATFPIHNIQVLEGVDPRTNPNNPLEAVVIQNVPKEARSTTTAVKARQSKSNGLWYPDSTASAPANIVQGTLKTDLTVFMTTVVIVVTAAPSGAPVAVGSELTVQNPPDLLANAATPRRLHAGNRLATCHASEYAGGWRLDGCQPPLVRPVAP